MKDSKNNGYLLIIIAVVIWSLNGILVKSVDVDPLWIMFIRSLGGGVFLIPYIFKQKIGPMKNVVLAGIFMATFLLAITATTRISTAAMAVAMQYTAPMYVIVFGFYKNKKVELSKLIVVLLILAGIIFSILSSMKDSNNLAIITGLVIGIAFVFYSYNVKSVNEGNALGIVSLTNLVSAIFYIILLTTISFIQPFGYKPQAPTQLNHILVLTMSGIIISGLSYAFYGAGLRKVPMEKALIICLAEPILNPIWVYFGKGEIPDTTTLIGVILILIGAVTDILFNNKEESNELEQLKE